MSKKCRFCRTDIDDDAVVCPICQKHQSKTRNELIFFGAIFGLVSGIGSAFLFGIDQIDQLYNRYIVGDNLEVVQLRVHDDAVIYNSGYRPVNITSVEFEWRPNLLRGELARSARYDAYTTINSGELGRFFVGRYRRHQMLGVDPETSEATINDITCAMIDGSTDEVQPLFSYSEDSDTAHVLTAFSADEERMLVTDSCSGQLFYIPAGETNEQSLAFECTVYAIGVPDEEAAMREIDGSHCATFDHVMQR